MLMFSLVITTQKYTKLYYMRLWQTEYFAMNFETGELQKVIGEFLYEGINFEQATLALVKSKQPWLRLTGNWYEKKENYTTEGLKNNTPIVENEPKYTIDWSLLDDIKDFVKSMSLDDFLDWLDLQEFVYIQELLEKCREGKLDAYAKTIEGHLKNKYGKSNEENLNN